MCIKKVLYSPKPAACLCTQLNVGMWNKAAPGVLAVLLPQPDLKGNQNVDEASHSLCHLQARLGFQEASGC